MRCFPPLFLKTETRVTGLAEAETKKQKERRNGVQPVTEPSFGVPHLSDAVPSSFLRVPWLALSPDHLIVTCFEILFEIWLHIPFKTG